MPFSIYIGWGLLLPIGLSLLYGFTTAHAMEVLGYASGSRISAWPRVSIPAMLLFVLWCIVGFPLPLLYILGFFAKLTRLISETKERAKELFLINFTHLITMALHMILIGVISLAVRMPMNELLEQPLWRIVTISIVLAANNLIAHLIPRWKTVLSVLRTQSESEEGKPFLVFLWFCDIFLLLDSVLCVSDVGWEMLPLFLIGSTLLLELYLIGFLWHLYSILKVRYLEEEHRRLLEKLEEQNRSAEELRSKTALDPMTGIFSRRYAMDQAELLLKEGEPFSLAYLDMDGLKRVNDRQGHPAGDRYLIRFARELGAHLRKADIFARVGGDEFAVLFPGCARETAKRRMEEIRTRLTTDFDPPFPFSYGLAAASGAPEESVEQIFREADRAMYRDKQARTRKEGGIPC